MRNIDNLVQCKRDLRIRENQLNAKNVQFKALQEKNTILEAKVKAAELHIITMLNMMDLNSVKIDKKDLKKAMQTRLSIQIMDDSFIIEKC